MQIDWVTVSAQVVNFLVLVALLRHFLYQPVIQAMDRREERIASRLEEAHEREQEAEETAKSHREEREELEKRRESILTEAREEAERKEQELFDEAHRKVDEKRQDWQAQVEEEQERFLSDLRQEAAGAIQAGLRSALRDLADAELEERILEVFTGKLEALGEEARQELVEDSSTLHVASAFELDASTRDRLTRALHEHLDEDLDVEYRRSPDLVCGIQLAGSERRVSWSLDGYLEELSTRVRESLEQARQSAAREAEGGR